MGENDFVFPAKRPGTAFVVSLSLSIYIYIYISIPSSSVAEACRPRRSSEAREDSSASDQRREEQAGRRQRSARHPHPTDPLPSFKSESEDGQAFI